MNVLSSLICAIVEAGVGGGKVIAAARSVGPSRDLMSDTTLHLIRVHSKHLLHS